MPMLVYIEKFLYADEGKSQSHQQDNSGYPLG